MQVTADYIPAKAGDEGGIIVWKDGYFKLEFLESLDTTTKEYSQWRAHKIGSRWEFSADRGSGYELFDAAFLDATKAGIILKNPYEDGYEPLRLDRVILCRGKKVSVGNLGPGYTVYLCDENGYEVKSLVVPPEHSGVEFELPTIPFTGMIRVFGVGNAFLSSIGPTVMYGGDVFVLGTDLEVWWNGKELRIDSSTYLGTMYDNQILVQMEVRNPTTATYAQDIKVSVMQYLNEFGYEWVDVAPDVGGLPGEFADTINIGDLAPQEGKYIWVKVTRLEPIFQLDPADFILDITHL
ncbi:cell adhesion protein [Brevibacillus sp. SYP-B805]|uniref:cell adhesion protein n=1 Tax=Brevibacillus sp. SYP-B805 TaxID=1578199 RepID=UPI001F495663|nr:cell adhesion protein [Brevibacillus sp. SYP-B805]